MDEVDIDNMEDLNELEARLYAQIHHETTEESNVHPSLQSVQNNENNVLNTAAKSNDAGSNEENYETSSTTNRILSRRYWATGEHAVKQQQPNNHQQQTQNSQQQQPNQQNKNKQCLIRNPFKQPIHHQQHQNNIQQKDDSLISTIAYNKSQNHQQSKQIENQLNSTSTTSKNSEHVKSFQSNNKSNTEKNPTSAASKSTNTSPTTISENPKQDTPTTSNEIKKNKNTKTNNNEQQSTNANLKPAAVAAAEKSNLKVNPVVKWIEKNKNQNNKKQSNNNNNNANNKNSKNSSNNNKQGPFGKQQQKLQKAKRLEDKKQKSKKAKNNAAVIANKLKPTEIIDLVTENESDSSDVIVIPTEPPPTYTVEDSGDEYDKKKVATIIAQEENALDSTDVQMSSTSSSFIKPQQISKQTLASAAEQRLEDSSRCTSPCSIQSSDDFIGQNDRSRLLVGASGMADDEDLLVLTNDINSLLEVPDNKKQTVDHDKDRDNEESPLDTSVERVQPEENMENNYSLEFATPKTSKEATRPRDYRVDQSQFRALDVYESESDITDSVYSKGANKSATVIRQIDTSSDEVEDISICSQRTKRLRKRRASSSNKESDPNNENSASSSDNDHGDDEDDNKLLRTNIPFIARGPAVERSKLRKRSRTLSTCSPIVQKRKAAKTLATGGHMSDNEFIATLNNLAHGQEKEQEQLQEEDEESDESETENVPTARDIAEKILARHNEKETAKKSVAEEMAVPEDVLNDLDKVFETIDQMDKREAKKQQISTTEDTVKISDSSDSDREKHFIYKSVPNEDAQIIVYSPDTTKKDKQSTKKHTYAENGSPIYNVVYSRGQRKAGGIGWNEEMRKFYNDSWNGEHFILSKVLQKMNPDKNLWKIYTEDRFNIKTKRHNNMKCTNCCEFGHMRSKCKRPKKPMICYMCGDSGHHEPRCPNTICLRCGNKTQVFTKCCNACSYQNRLTCPICKIKGHSLDYCPDKWRRYHSTTEPNTYPNNSITYNPRKYCCICGGRGHLSDTCRSAVRFMEYPAIVSTVKSHQKSYSDIVVKTPHNGIALNLMYEPCEEYKFDLADRTTLQKYYGRFLKAVDLDHLLQRKRHVSATSTTAETPDSTAKKAKRLSKRYEANPYSKIGTANQKSGESSDNAPNQVQEISESGNTEKPDQQEEGKNTDEQPQVIDIDETSVDTAGSDNEVELVESTMEDVHSANIQLNIINERTNYGEQHDENFKSPKKVTSTTTSSNKKQAEPPVVMDSDSNYSFSEHFDVPPTAVEKEEEQSSENVEKTQEENTTTEHMKDSREMESMPDYIPLIDSTEDQVEEISDNAYVGISRRFVPAETDEEMEEEEHDKRKTSSPVPELPCEAKIYLTHFHSKYLLSPVGNAFLVKTSRAHKLKTRLDFTSIGHVLVIFGMPSDQDNFQRELLLKYRELEDESNQKQTQSNLNVPKRTDVLIKFLRENITQLLNNLGNVNHLLKRLQFLERRQSKWGYKLAEKVRRSLNMILVGQAGLQDGTMHLDKLLISLKTLMNDYNSEDVTPPQLRSEITDHWKVIFTPYRHENYQQLVNAYNKLISKNRVPKLEIDPILLGHKVLDTSLTEEQKLKLEQPRTPTITNSSNHSTETPKQIVPNPLNQKNTKLLKRKHNSGATSPSPTVTNTTPTTHKTKTPISRPVSPVKISQTNTTRGDNNAINTTNVKNKTTSNTPASSTPKTSKTANNTPTSAKAKSSTNTTPNPNKSKQNTNSTNAIPTTNTSTTTTAAPKKQTPKIMPPPPFINPENRSKVSTIIQEVSDKWKSTCDTILTQISSDKPSGKKDGRKLDSKLPSTFWSRESMRYLDDCVLLAASRPQVVEKLKRVQNKSKNGQLSYNDYLAVIKLHTALNGKCDDKDLINI